MANVREAIDLHLQDLVDAGEPIPPDQGTIELPEPVRRQCMTRTPHGVSARNFVERWKPTALFNAFGEVLLSSITTTDAELLSCTTL